jgi:hypothetical protein
MVGEREQRRENAVGVSHGTLHLLCRSWHTVDYFPFCIIKMGDGRWGWSQNCVGFLPIEAIISWFI